MGFVKHKTDFDVLISVSARIAALEKLVYDEGPDRCERSYTLGAELGNIHEGRQKRWTVSMPEDVEPVSKSIIEAIRHIGVPYLERYSVLEIALAALSGDDKDAWLHSPVHIERAKRAIGLAFLLRNNDAFHKLVADKTEFLTSRNDPKLQEFLEFVRKLTERLGSS